MKVFVIPSRQYVYILLFMKLSCIYISLLVPFKCKSSQWSGSQKDVLSLWHSKLVNSVTMPSTRRMNSAHRAIWRHETIIPMVWYGLLFLVSQVEPWELLTSFRGCFECCRHAIFYCQFVSLNMRDLLALYPQHLCKTIDTLHFYISSDTLTNTHKPLLNKDILSN